MLRVRYINPISSRMVPALAAAAIAVTALSGCGAMHNRHNITVGSVPDDYRTSHPIILNEREEILDVPVSASDSHITVAQRSSIQAFMAQSSSASSGVVQILMPPARQTPPPPSASCRISFRAQEKRRAGRKCRHSGV